MAAASPSKNHLAGAMPCGGGVWILVSGSWSLQPLQLMALLPRQPQEKYERCMLGNVSLLGSAAPTGRCGAKVSRKVTQLPASRAWVQCGAEVQGSETSRDQPCSSDWTHTGSRSQSLLGSAGRGLVEDGGCERNVTQAVILIGCCQRSQRFQWRMQTMTANQAAGQGGSSHCCL